MRLYSNMNRFHYIGLLLGVLFLIFHSSESILFSSAPQNIVAATNTIIGTAVILSVVGFYIVGIIVLIFTVSYASKEAKAVAFDELDGVGAGAAAGRYLGSNSVSSTIEYYLNSVFDVNTQSCFAKLLCELESDPLMEKESEEKMLLSIFGEYFMNSLSENNKNVNRSTENIKYSEHKEKKQNSCLEKYEDCEYSFKNFSVIWQLILELRKNFA